MKNLPDISTHLEGLTTRVRSGAPGSNAPEEASILLWNPSPQEANNVAPPPPDSKLNRAQRRAREKWEREQRTRARHRATGLRARWAPFLGQTGVWMFFTPAVARLPDKGGAEARAFADVGHLARLVSIVPEASLSSEGKPDPAAAWVAVFAVASSEDARAYLAAPGDGTWHYEYPFEICVTLDRIAELVPASRLLALAAQGLEAPPESPASSPSPAAAFGWGEALPVVPAAPPALPTEIPE